jgi:hypothetical protein
VPFRESHRRAEDCPAPPLRVRLFGGVGQIGGSQIWKGLFIFLKPSHFFLVMGTNLKVEKENCGALFFERGATREGDAGFSAPISHENETQ